MRNISTPQDAGYAVYDAFVDIIGENATENEKRKSRFQKPLPEPEPNVQEMIDMAKSLAKDAHTRQALSGNIPSKGIQEWQDEAVHYLKKEIVRYAQTDGEPKLMQQIYKIWPDTKPAPNLNNEQKARLIELQRRFDDITTAMSQTVKDCMTELQELIREEVSITAGTAECTRQHILRQAGCYIGLWDGLMRNMLVRAEGRFATPPDEQVERNIMSRFPRKWTDKD